MRSTECLRISVVLRKCGLSFIMTHEFAESEISQSVNAYSASIVTSGDTSGLRVISMRTVAAVLSSMCLIFILPFSLALFMDSVRLSVVVP